MYAAVDDLKAQRFVRALRDSMVNPGIRCHLNAALVSRPLLGGPNEPSSDSLPAMSRINVPSFNEADGMRRIATVGM